MDTLETIAKHRAEIGNEAAVQWVTLHFYTSCTAVSVILRQADRFPFLWLRLEAKKRQKKPEVKDPKLKELQERLEARKAGLFKLQ